MCKRPPLLRPDLRLNLTTHQKISSNSLSEEQLALKAKKDARAAALLRALAPFQITNSSPDVSAYPALSAALAAKREKSK